MNALIKFFDWFVGRNRVEFVGVSGSGKSTILKVLEKRKDISPQEIEKMTNGTHTFLGEFEGVKIRCIDYQGREDVVSNPKFYNIIEDSHYVIYIFDCNRYLEEKLHKQLPIHPQYDIYHKYGENAPDAIEKHIKQVEGWLKRIIDCSSKLHKKFLIVGTHKDLFLLANPDKNIEDINIMLNQTLLSKYHSAKALFIDATKIEEARIMIEALKEL